MFVRCYLGVCLKSIERNAMTDSCKEDCECNCIHEEEGCLGCGTITGLDDNAYCDICSFERDSLTADIMYDQKKEEGW